MGGRDSGVTWSSDVNLTNDTNNSVGPSVALSGTGVHVLWCDTRDGNAEIYYVRNPNGNSGVEEASGRFQPLTSNLSISVVPDPFTSFASVPGHFAESFALYDIAGRLVGTYKGNRIGEGLVPGVYFIRAESREGKLARIVKVR